MFWVFERRKKNLKSNHEMMDQALGICFLQPCTYSQKLAIIGKIYRFFFVKMCVSAPDFKEVGWSEHALSYQSVHGQSLFSINQIILKTYKLKIKIRMKIHYL